MSVTSPTSTRPTGVDPAGAGLPLAVTIVLAFLTAVAPLATDMYLPAFPQMATELGTSASAVQLTLTTFMIGLAVGQLVIGPLSDQRGRRGLLIVGTAVYTVAGAACALAPSIGVLIGARFVHGFAGAAGIVLARAVVADRATGAAAAKLFGLMMMIQGIAPVAAPLLGGGLSGAIGWRGIFWVLTAVSALMLVSVVVLVPETLPVDKRTTGGLAATARDARRVLGNRRYLGYTGAMVFAFAGMFAYISASPFVLQNVLGLSVGWYSVAFAVNALGIAAASAVNAQLVGRFSPAALLRTGIVALVAIGLLLVLDATVLGLPLWPTLVLLFASTSSLGLIAGNATGLATDQAAGAAGTGSAVMGALQFALGAAVSPVVGLAGEYTAVPMAITMAVVAVLAAGSLLLARPRN
ncbi:multidrug effflux MFS transporter [Cellulomonas sp. NPDC089187]|uniref:multidrug effflux MFS transporter n=1 Tax=Cellulomonas sp. NPDC089187 TaxID=3154970 RepID=UPI00344AEBED